MVNMVHVTLGNERLLRSNSDVTYLLCSYFVVSAFSFGPNKSLLISGSIYKIYVSAASSSAIFTISVSCSRTCNVFGCFIDQTHQYQAFTPKSRQQVPTARRSERATYEMTSSSYTHLPPPQAGLEFIALQVWYHVQDPTQETSNTCDYRRIIVHLANCVKDLYAQLFVLSCLSPKTSAPRVLDALQQIGLLPVEMTVLNSHLVLSPAGSSFHVTAQSCALMFASFIEVTDDMDKEIHDHKRTEAMKNGKAFSQWTEKLFSPPTSWLCFIEFGQKTIDGRIGDTGVSLKLQVARSMIHCTHYIRELYVKSPGKNQSAKTVRQGGAASLESRRIGDVRFFDQS
ncbi:hypothetical protein BD769DRAFT_1395477 [Suillus cothurnatus]|nr:hypothetical protein BD769DRAFT_1395477 [Suillus cothurnatus]